MTVGASTQRSLRTLLPLLGSTVWSCPVWLQTKRQGFSTTSDHQTEFNAHTFHGKEDVLDVTHLAIVHLSSLCFQRLDILAHALVL